MMLECCLDCFGIMVESFLGHLGLLGSRLGSCGSRLGIVRGLFGELFRDLFLIVVAFVLLLLLLLLLLL